MSSFTSRSPLCLNAFLGCFTSKGLSKLQVKLPFARNSDSNSAPRMHEAHMNPWILELLQPLPARVPVKPTQVPLQEPAAAKPQTQCRCIFQPSIVFGDAGQGEDSLLNFRTPLYPLAMVRFWTLDLFIRCSLSLRTRRSARVQRSHDVRLTAFRPQVHGGEGSKDRDGLSASHRHLPDADNVMTSSQMPWALMRNPGRLRYLALDILIGHRRRTLEPRFADVSVTIVSRNRCASLLEFYLTVAHFNHATAEASTMHASRQC
ncbi:hypothetical protein B0H13DRAFT_2268870 [Mycena leptocephala]|nr:hypothetical protein B0H13DRAFT_2268870 [Mycena leptocephala]